MTLDHVGIAVATPEHRALFERLLGAAPYKTETVERQGVRTVFFGDGGVAGAAPKLELLEATRDDSPIAGFLDRRGPGLHHLAFEVPDVEAAMAHARDLGFRLLADAPRPGADRTRIAFLHPKDTAGVLVELLESVRPAAEWHGVETPRGRLAVQVSGPDDAPPLMVLHGALGSTSLETDRLIRFWERDARVYGLDFLGHGRSADLPEDAPTWDHFTADAAAVLDHFGIQDAALFGFSMGAGIALALAAERPGVRAVVAHAPNVRWTDAEVGPMVGPMDPTRMAAEHPRWARRLEETHGPRWRRLAAQIAAFTRALPTRHLGDDRLGQIACPTLVSIGDRDRYFDVAHAVEVFRAVPDAHLRVIPGLDHPIQGVDAPALAADVLDFLRARPTAPA